MKKVAVLTVATLACGIGVGYAAKAKKPACNVSRVHYTFQSESKVPLKQGKAQLVVYTTTSAAKLNQVLSQISHMKSGKTLFHLVRFNQDKANSGLLNVSAYLEATLPMSEANVLYRFAKQHTRDGMTVKVLAFNPYLPPAATQRAQERLSFKLYRQAEQYAKALSKISGQHYVIKTFTTNGQAAPGNAMPRPVMLYRAKAMVAGGESNSAAAGVNVQQTLNMSANVVFQAPLKK